MLLLALLTSYCRSQHRRLVKFPYRRLLRHFVMVCTYLLTPSLLLVLALRLSLRHFSAKVLTIINAIKFLPDNVRKGFFYKLILILVAIIVSVIIIFLKVLI